MIRDAYSHTAIEENWGRREAEMVKIKAESIEQPGSWQSRTERATPQDGLSGVKSSSALSTQTGLFVLCQRAQIFNVLWFIQPWLRGLSPNPISSFWLVAKLIGPRCFLGIRNVISPLVSLSALPSLSPLPTSLAPTVA